MEQTSALLSVLAELGLALWQNLGLPFGKNVGLALWQNLGLPFGSAVGLCPTVPLSIDRSEAAIAADKICRSYGAPVSILLAVATNISLLTEL